jgi:hypothetical protein
MPSPIDFTKLFGDLIAFFKAVPSDKLADLRDSLDHVSVSDQWNMPEGWLPQGETSPVGPNVSMSGAAGLDAMIGHYMDSASASVSRNEEGLTAKFGRMVERCNRLEKAVAALGEYVIGKSFPEDEPEKKPVSSKEDEDREDEEAAKSRHPTEPVVLTMAEAFSTFSPKVAARAEKLCKAQEARDAADRKIASPPSMSAVAKSGGDSLQTAIAKAMNTEVLPDGSAVTFEKALQLKMLHSALSNLGAKGADGAMDRVQVLRNQLGI